jgi:hypothetical protein
VLLISVVVLAIVSAAYTFVPNFQAGVSSLAEDIGVGLGEHRIGLVGADATTGEGNQNQGHGAYDAYAPTR